MRILICEDDPSRAEALGASVAIACPGAEVQRAVPRTSVARAVAEAAPALTVVGPGLADADGGSELVRVLCAEHPELAVLVVSTHDLAAPAVAALRAGAADYVVLADGDDLVALGRAAARLVCRDGHRPPRPAGRAAPDALAGLVGRSPAIQQVRELVRTAARAEAHVLIEGETGTGKEVVARAVHALGRRAAGPFVPVNCAAVPRDARRERVLRARARRLHRRGAGAPGRAPARRPRHALPRRGRGPRARAPGEAPARRAGPRGTAARRLQRAAVRRPHRRRLEPRPLAHGRSGPVPPRPLLSAARVRDHAPAAPAAARRPPGAHRALHRALQPRAGHDLRAPAARHAPPAPRAPLARQRARARERARVAPRARRRGGRGAGRAARAPPGARGGPDGRRARAHRARARRASLEPAARRRRARHLARHALATHGAARHPRSARRAGA